MKYFLSTAITLIGSLHLIAADFRSDALNLHNKYRAKHHSPPMTLDNTVNTYSQNWAQTMASSGKFAHSSGGKYGENIYYYQGSTITDSDAATRAVDAWYNEVSKYNYDKPGFSMETGHFTQVVWKNSKSLGIGVARSGNKVYVCANYSPPGNYQGQFPANVLKP